MEFAVIQPDWSTILSLISTGLCISLAVYALGKRQQAADFEEELLNAETQHANKSEAWADQRLEAAEERRKAKDELHRVNAELMNVRREKVEKDQALDTANSQNKLLVDKAEEAVAAAKREIQNAANRQVDLGRSRDLNAVIEADKRDLSKRLGQAVKEREELLEEHTKLIANRDNLAGLYSTLAKMYVDLREATNAYVRRSKDLAKANVESVNSFNEQLQSADLYGFNPADLVTIQAKPGSSFEPEREPSSYAAPTVGSLGTNGMAQIAEACKTYTPFPQVLQVGDWVLHTPEFTSNVPEKNAYSARVKDIDVRNARYVLVADHDNSERLVSYYDNLEKLNEKTWKTPSEEYQDPTVPGEVLGANFAENGNLAGFVNRVHGKLGVVQVG